MKKVKLKSKKKIIPTERRSSVFGHIDRYYLPNIIFYNTMKELRKHGKRRREGLVLWAGGISSKDEAYVMTQLIPKRGNWGGGVKLDSETLINMYDQLARRDLVLLAQVHTHPGDFGHSWGDEKYAVDYRIGFISIVVPDFAQRDFNDFSDCYVYEYCGKWNWELLNKEQKRERFIIEETEIII